MRLLEEEGKRKKNFLFFLRNIKDFLIYIF